MHQHALVASHPGKHDHTLRGRPIGGSRLSHGPSAVLPRVLAGVPGIDEAHIYGSWAARRLGEPGSPPGDVDVLVVGNPPRMATHDAAAAAEHMLGREVSIRIVTPDAWAANEDLFVRTLHERPLVRLTLESSAS